MRFSPVKTFFKALGLAAVCGAIGFFIGVFLSIVGVAVYGWLAKQQPDFTMTYKFFGDPFGALVFVVVVVGVWVRDLKRGAEAAAPTGLGLFAALPRHVRGGLPYHVPSALRAESPVK